MKIKILILLLVFSSLFLHSQETNDLPIDDSRFIVSFQDIQFTTGSNITILLNAIKEEAEITKESFQTYYRWEGIELRLFRDYSEMGLISISSDKFEMLSGVKIGQTIEEVIAKNGVPDSKSPAQLFYSISMDQSEVFLLLELQFQNNILTKIVLGSAI